MAGSGLKQITLTPGILAAQPLTPWLEYGVPREITSIGARCARASRSATARRSPGPSSITMASTLAGMPCCGQTNKRAVATPSPVSKTSKTEMTCRQRRPRRSAGLGVLVFPDTGREHSGQAPSDRFAEYPPGLATGHVSNRVAVPSGGAARSLDDMTATGSGQGIASALRAAAQIGASHRHRSSPPTSSRPRAETEPFTAPT